MRQKLLIIWTILIGILMAYFVWNTFAEGFEIPGSTEIGKNSISVDWSGGTHTAQSLRDIGINILGVAKLVVSGFALIYLVMIGVWFVIGSDSEEKVRKQKNQIIYSLIAFIFLNVPGVIYQIISPDNLGSKDIGPIDDWKNHSWGILWQTAGFDNFFGNIVAFLRLFVFATAVLMLTWGLFRLLISGGDEEHRNRAKNRIIYGVAGLIFMWFVELWWRLIAVGNIAWEISGVSGQIVGIAIYFAGPAAIFMLILGAYYYLTSAGDEDRAKKGKAIVINTLIAAIILIATMSFLVDLIKLSV